VAAPSDCSFEINQFRHAQVEGVRCQDPEAGYLQARQQPVVRPLRICSSVGEEDVVDGLLVVHNLHLLCIHRLAYRLISIQRREVLHQQAVDEDIPAADAPQEDALDTVVEKRN
jgi:hypothetical protein